MRTTPIIATRQRSLSLAGITPAPCLVTVKLINIFSRSSRESAANSAALRAKRNRGIAPPISRDRSTRFTELHQPRRSPLAYSEREEKERDREYALIFPRLYSLPSYISYICYSIREEIRDNTRVLVRVARARGYYCLGRIRVASRLAFRVGSSASNERIPERTRCQERGSIKLAMIFFIPHFIFWLYRFHNRSGCKKGIIIPRCSFCSLYFIFSCLDTNLSFRNCLIRKIVKNFQCVKRALLTHNYSLFHYFNFQNCDVNILKKSEL